MSSKFRTNVRMSFLTLAAFGLFACNQERIAEPAGSKHGKAITGAARIALPALPKEYLSDSGGAEAAWFALTVSGAGMESIRKTWALKPGHSESLHLDGIPVGLRSFHGALLKISAGDTVITHEGGDSAWIERDSVAEVHLYLRRAGGGSARVCVEVEGWPADPSCIKPPIIPVIDYHGCWRITVQQHGVPPAADTFFDAQLSFRQNDSLLTAVVTWAGGAQDSASGYVINDGTVYIGYQGGAFTFKGGADSTGTYLRGHLRSPGRGVYGPITGKHGACAAPGTPPQPILWQTCYNTVRTLTGQAPLAGRLVLRFYDGIVLHGGFHWSGLPGYGADAGGSAGSPSGTFEVDLRVFGQSGTPEQGSEWVYSMNLEPVGPTLGTIFGVTFDTLKPVGTWTAERSQCGDYEAP
jgi:hypothetical protein